jgi:uncharacterized protein
VNRLVVDTSGYLVGGSVGHPLRTRATELLTGADQPPIVSPLVVAEIDYLVLDKLGVARELAVIADLTSGAYEIPDLDVDDLRAAGELVARYRDLKIGLTDAVNIVLADRFDTDAILTTDQRHFRALKPLSRQFPAFRLLPHDD